MLAGLGPREPESRAANLIRIGCNFSCSLKFHELVMWMKIRPILMRQPGHWPDLPWCFRHMANWPHSKERMTNQYSDHPSNSGI